MLFKDQRSARRESRIYSGSETQIFHDFKFESNAYEKAAKDGFGDCEYVSGSSSVDIDDVWEKDVYSIRCYKL